MLECLKPQTTIFIDNISDDYVDMLFLTGLIMALTTRNYHKSWRIDADYAVALNILFATKPIAVNFKNYVLWQFGLPSLFKKKSKQCQKFSEHCWFCSNIQCGRTVVWAWCSEFRGLLIWIIPNKSWIDIWVCILFGCVRILFMLRSTGITVDYINWAL